MTDPAARLTPMAVLVLALLSESDMHPYEMVRLLRQRRDERLVRITNGTLYHSVSRLLEQGLISEVGVDRDGNRPERTTYALAPEGRDALSAWVRTELARIDRPAQFRVALAEAHNVDLADVIDLLRIRRVALADERQLLGGGLQDAQQKGIPAQFLIEIERQQALLDAELTWMDSLIERLEAGTIPWGRTGFSDTDRYRAQRKAAQQ